VKIYSHPPIRLYGVDKENINFTKIGLINLCFIVVLNPLSLEVIIIVTLKVQKFYVLPFLCCMDCRSNNSYFLYRNE